MVRFFEFNLYEEGKMRKFFEIVKPFLGAWLKIDNRLKPCIGNRVVQRLVFRGSSSLTGITFGLPVILLTTIFLIAPINEIRKEAGYSWKGYLERLISAAIVPNPGMPLSGIQLDLAFRIADVNDEEAKFFLIVAPLESGMFSCALNENVHGDGEEAFTSKDIGLLQVNTHYWKKLFENPLYPEVEGCSVITNLKFGKVILAEQGEEAWVALDRKGDTPTPERKPIIPPKPEEKPATRPEIPAVPVSEQRIASS